MAALPMYVGVLFIPNATLAMIAMAPTYFFLHLCLSPTFALFQNLADPRMRAMATAVALLVINLIGMGFGPLFIGFVSDMLLSRYGSVEALRISMLCGLSVLAWSAFHYWWAGRTIDRDLSTAKDQETIHSSEADISSDWISKGAEA